jgi:hypothetical protein
MISGAHVCVHGSWAAGQPLGKLCEAYGGAVRQEKGTSKVASRPSGGKSPQAKHSTDPRQPGAGDPWRLRGPPCGAPACRACSAPSRPLQGMHSACEGIAGRYPCPRGCASLQAARPLGRHSSPCHNGACHYCAPFTPPPLPLLLSPRPCHTKPAGHRHWSLPRGLPFHSCLEPSICMRHA